MQNTTKRIRTGLLACAMAAASLLYLPQGMPAGAEVQTYEFETGVSDRIDVYTDTEGWTDTLEDGTPYDYTNPSGNGFVYLKDKGSSVTVTVEVAQAGIYNMGIRYCEPSDPNKKVQYLDINGVNQGEVTFPYCDTWREISTLVKLDAGKNDIQFRSYWGYTALDCMTIATADSSITDLNPTKSLSNPNANDTTKRLYSYLCSVYGEHILSGQQEMCGSHNYNINADPNSGYIKDNEAEFEYILDKTGKQPAIRGIDFLNFFLDENDEMLYDDNAAERAIEWTNVNKGIVALSWHWFVPSSTGDYAFYVQSANASYTDFSITKALQEGTKENKTIMADIKLIASKLQLLEDADVSVIWRPLHEAEGAWFWWGAEGPEACVALYRLLYDQLTNVYGLDNLIWEWTSYTSPNSSKWYPGDDVVDMIGYDKYNVADGIPNPSAIPSTFYSLVQSTNGQKLVAMSENDAIPSLDNLVNDRAAWLYFCPWYGYFLTGEINNPVDLLTEVYQSEYCITLDELPDIRSFPMLEDTHPVTTSTTTSTTTTETKPVTLYGDINNNQVVSISDLVMMARYVAEDAEMDPPTAQGLLNADCAYDGKINSSDVTALARFLAHLITQKDLGPQA